MKPRNLIVLSLILIALMPLSFVSAQESDPILPYKVAPQNLLKFNRFLINPTFSTVREENSYINLLHRNQSVQFQDNDQTYFLSYSGRIGDRSGLGLSLYNQKVGPISNIGILANYAYGIKLSDKSNFTFGGNLAYYSSGLNRNSVDVIDQNDFRLNGTEDSNVLSFQPGFNISYGQFDFGVFAENLFDYNLKTNETLTDFADKTYSAHLQYTYPFENGSGVFESARLMPLARARMNAQNGALETDGPDLSFGGSLVLDLPKLGWLQGGYDTFYGASAGAGFNLNQRLSLGYTMEKGFGTDFNNLGVTHEISFAYSFTPNLTEDRVMFEEDNTDELVENEELNLDDLAANNEIEELKRKLAENDAVLAELMYRQDSLEAERQQDLERRFEMVMRMVRNETKGKRPDVEKRAESLFLKGKDSQVLVQNDLENTVPDPEPVYEQKRPVLNPVAPQTSNSVAKDNTTITHDLIKSRKFKNLDGVDNGYYIIANVYSGGKYMNKFMSSLSNDGFTPDFVDNPNNGLKYVYLERFDSWKEAADAYKSNMNGEYNDALWIMNVENTYSNNAYATNTDRLRKESNKYSAPTLDKNTTNAVRDKILASDLKTKTYELDGVGEGYYIIANVFAVPSNANRFVKLLNSYGLSASYFINPENNWRYVYLKRHESWNNALISYYSKINDSYDDKMWIMRVKSNLIA
jgi:type IX secretion system PorP/SprF family membrane protein